MSSRGTTTPTERLISAFDRALRTLAAPAHGRRPNPAEGQETRALAQSERRHAAGLMRINHTGEVCAQALYQGQGLTARNPDNRRALAQAAEEELDHLAWCEQRLTELGARGSILNPLFYAGAFTLGALAGAMGDRWSLGFVVETERQVEHHLDGHLERLPEGDQRSRAILEQMRTDERGHGDTATRLGAATLPAPAKSVMRLVSRVMTSTTYHL